MSNVEWSFFAGRLLCLHCSAGVGEQRRVTSNNCQELRAPISGRLEVRLWILTFSFFIFILKFQSKFHMKQTTYQ